MQQRRMQLTRQRVGGLPHPEGLRLTSIAPGAAGSTMFDPRLSQTPTQINSEPQNGRISLQNQQLQSSRSQPSLQTIQTMPTVQTSQNVQN